MSRWTDKFSYWTGTQIRAAAGAFLAGHDAMMEKRVPHSLLAILQDGKWSSERLTWTGIGICWATKPRPELVVVGYEGEILAGPIGQLQSETPIEIESGPKIGYLKCARSIAGRVFIGGMDRQAYRRSDTGGWEALDDGLPPGGEGEVVSFEAIDGFSESEIYGVGREGEIWRYDGTRWHRVDSPTNVILLGVHCADDGYAYACGQVGTLLRGRGDNWEVIEHGATEEDIWDVAKFRNGIYLATRQVLYVIKDDAAAPVDFGDDIDTPFTFYRFALSKEELWSIGSKDVVSFDGQRWTRID